MIVAQKKPKSSRTGRKSDTPDAPQPSASDKLPTIMVRVPGEIGEMLRAIEQHRLNGWNTVSKILDDARCPLADWLRPYYEQVIREKAKLAAAIKKQSEEE